MCQKKLESFILRCELFCFFVLHTSIWPAQMFWTTVKRLQIKKQQKKKDYCLQQLLYKLLLICGSVQAFVNKPNYMGKLFNTTVTYPMKFYFQE